MPAQLMGFSGFSATNYLEQPYNPDLDFGTGDFCVMGWVNMTNVTAQVFLDRTAADYTGGRIYVYANGNWKYSVHASGLTTDTGVAATTGLHFVVMLRVGGVLKWYIDTVEIYSIANTANVSNAAAKLFVGIDASKGSPAYASTMALWRISATVPSVDQIAHIYRTELAMFQPNAKCTIEGTSTAVNAIAFDEDTELLHVGTSWGRSAFKDLTRVESEATSTGSITTLSASGGTLLTGGATAARLYQPALLLRDELKRKAEARKALGQTPEFFQFDSVTSQTDFVLPKGWKIKAVYTAGTLKREGTTKDYTIVNDGFKETVKFNVAPANATWVSIMAVRA